MDTRTSSFLNQPAWRRILAAILLISILSSCTLPSLPWKRKPQPTTAPEIKQPTPTEKPRPALPPAIVETSPTAGMELALDGVFSISFSEPMDRQSVEAAVHVQPGIGGSFSWEDDATLVFTPDQPLAPDSGVSVTVEASARAANGLAMPAAREITFQSAGLLKITQRLPEPDSKDIDPTSAVVLAFNRPVVPLAADSAGLPAAFTLDPAVKGRAEWINTSTYIFYPEPSLGGGMTYTAQVNPKLRGVNGEPLLDMARSDSPAGSWSFTTALPAISEVVTDRGKLLGISDGVTVVFNQPMNTASVEAAFSFGLFGGSPAAGKFTWEENDTRVTFQPDQQLERSSRYDFSLAAGARSAGGAEMGESPLYAFSTYPPLSVTETVPANGGILDNIGGYAGPTVYFSAPVFSSGIQDRIKVTPEVTNLYPYFNEENNSLILGGYYTPGQTYTVTIPADLLDIWGYRIQEAYTYSFQAGPAAPNLTLGDNTYGGNQFVISPADLTLPSHAVNISSLNLSRRDLDLQEFIRMSSEGQPAMSGRNWIQNLNLTQNTNQAVDIRLDPQGQPLDTGMYLLTARSSELADPAYRTALIVVSPLQVIFKKSSDEVLVWVVNGDSGQPAGSAPLKIYDSSGTVLAEGQTDQAGLFKSSIPKQTEDISWKPLFAVVGTPGQAAFGLAASTWNSGLNGWDFGLNITSRPAGLLTYLYSDRPIYRPGQTMYFRAVVRQADNAHYSLPDVFHLPVKILGTDPATYESITLYDEDLQLNDFGTASGSYSLPGDLAPGYYELRSTTQPETSLYFQVAEYRKPEINLETHFSRAEILDGDKLSANVQADYFFGAPASGLAFNWTLFERPYFFNLPGSAVGPVDTGWLEPFWFMRGQGFGTVIASGSGETGLDGSFVINLPTRGDVEPAAGATRQLALEVTAADESGFSVSARAETTVHPEGYYLGVKPDSWNGRAGEALGFQVQSVAWLKTAVSLTDLEARFSRVVWKEIPPADQLPGMFSTFEPQYTLIGSSSFNTGADGLARLSFTPPEPGTYQLDVSGGNALTQVILWVGGPSAAIWPNLPDQHIELTANAETYKPGDKASVFIPNPFAKPVSALLTRERSRIWDERIVTIEAGGSLVDLALTADDSPTMYFAVTLLGEEDGHASFRQGYVKLPVDPIEQTLNVELVSQPKQTGPGDEVTLSLKVTDSAGKPVRGEFSLALVDLAALALAEPNSKGIVDYFYGEQPLGVTTSLSLVVSPIRDTSQGGIGGGGGDGSAPVAVRDEFKDTAYWNAVIVTGEDGLASVSVRLPENLTTWKADLRGVTAASQTGEADLKLVSTRSLLIRPEVPRFAVLGDHMALAAVINNNSGESIQVSAVLEAPGFELDDPQAASQPFDLPIGDSVRVEWWGTVGNVEEIDPLFRVNGGGYVDAARPELGPLPVLKYVSPQTFSTAGVLADPGDVVEVIGMPRSYTPVGGVLNVDLSPSLAAAILRSLEVHETPRYETPESILSAFLPNLQTYLLLAESGLEKPELKPALDEAVRSGIGQLQARQNPDGGWSWGSGDTESNLYLTAYVLFGLTQARDAGFETRDFVLLSASSYLRSQGRVNENSENYQLDQAAFAGFALAAFDGIPGDDTALLFDLRARLNPWAQALLALSLDIASPGDADARTLVSDLQGKALRSATGAHWESENESWINPGTPIQTTAVVIYALSRLDPASDLLPDALRYLASHRLSGISWGSTFDTAWVLLAFGQALKGTGELQASFDYSASLNDAPLVQGKAEGSQLLEGVQADTPLEDLYQDSGNALTIHHGQGSGRLYYRAALQLYRPAEDAPPLSRGITVTREVFLAGQDCKKATCQPVNSAVLPEGGPASLLSVRLTVTVAEDMYNLVVEDTFPSGAEAVNAALKTSQAGVDSLPSGVPEVDASNPYGEGWGWCDFYRPACFR